MPIRFKTVSSHLDAINEFLSAPKDASAIVPNNRWVDEINGRLLNPNPQFAIRNLHSSVLLGRRVWNIQEFILENTSPFHPVIPRPLQRHLLRDIMKSGQLSYFKQVSNGTIGQFLDAISSLKKARILPDELEHILETRGGPREADLLSVYRTYQDELSKRGWHDEADPWLVSNERTENRIQRTDSKPLIARLRGPPSLKLRRGYGFGGQADHQPLVHLIGFDDPLPQYDTFSNLDIIHYLPDSKMPATAPDVQVATYPGLEARFIAQKIAELVSCGIPPQEIGICLTEFDPFAWDVARELSSAGLIQKTQLPLTPMASRMSAKLLSSLPPKAGLKEYTHLVEGSGSFPTHHHGEAGDKLVARSMINLADIGRFALKSAFRTAQLGDIGLTRDEFIEALREELTPSRPDISPFKLIRWDDVGAYSLKAIILTRLNEGVFPRPTTSQAFFTEPDTLSPSPDSRIECIFPGPHKALATEFNRFKQAFREITVITCSEFTEHGGEATPSSFIMRWPKKSSKPKAQSSKIPTEQSSTGAFLSSPDILTKLRGQLTKFSATKLERYAECPFAYFCRYVLGIEPPEEAAPEVIPRDRGILIHKILEEFFRKYGKKLIETRSPFVDVDAGQEVKTRKQEAGNMKHDNHASCFMPHASYIFQSLRPIVDEVFNKKIDITSKYHPHLVARLKERSLLLTAQVIANEVAILQETLPVPTYFEHEFDEEVLPSIRIEGIIDRIDVADNTFVIIDYKTGKVGTLPSGIEKGTHLQLPIYILAAQKFLNKEPAGAFLLSVPDAARKSGLAREVYKKTHFVAKKTVTDEEWKRLINLAVEYASDYVAGIYRGEFPVREGGCESYCDWKDVCRGYK